MLAGNLLQNEMNAPEDLFELRLVRKRGQSEMIAIGRIEARTRSHKDVLPLKQLHGEMLVVETREKIPVDADECIHRTFRCHDIQKRTRLP